MSVREVGTAEFLQLAGRTEGKLVVVQFSATWCGPCRRVSPEYEALARTTPDVEFVKVRVLDVWNLRLALDLHKVDVVLCCVRIWYSADVSRPVEAVVRVGIELDELSKLST